MIREAVILAGGFGTRLRSIISEIPKPMAPIGDTPFIYYLLKQLQHFKINKVVLSVGYKYESIIEYFGYQFENMELSYSIEETPLGTGGGVKLAISQIQEDKFILLNGDSFFGVDLTALANFHISNKAEISLSLKPLSNFDRYGSVSIDDNNKVCKFLEKQPCRYGLINGGIYIINKQIFNHIDTDKFSLEKDILEPNVKHETIYGFISDSFFIDIGIPEDYSKAETLKYKLTEY